MSIADVRKRKLLAQARQASHAKKARPDAPAPPLATNGAAAAPALVDGAPPPSADATAEPSMYLGPVHTWPEAAGAEHAHTSSATAAMDNTPQESGGARLPTSAAAPLDTLPPPPPRRVSRNGDTLPAAPAERLTIGTLPTASLQRQSHSGSAHLPTASGAAAPASESRHRGARREEAVLARAVPAPLAVRAVALQVCTLTPPRFHCMCLPRTPFFSRTSFFREGQGTTA